MKLAAQIAAGLAALGLAVPAFAADTQSPASSNPPAAQSQPAGGHRHVRKTTRKVAQAEQKSEGTKAAKKAKKEKKENKDAAKTSEQGGAKAEAPAPAPAK